MKPGNHREPCRPRSGAPASCGAAMSVSGRFGDAPPNGPSVNTISVASTYADAAPAAVSPAANTCADSRSPRLTTKSRVRGVSSLSATRLLSRLPSSSNERSISAAAALPRTPCRRPPGQDVAVARAQRRDVDRQARRARRDRRRPRGSPAPAAHRSPRPAPTRPPRTVQVGPSRSTPRAGRPRRRRATRPRTCALRPLSSWRSLPGKRYRTRRAQMGYAHWTPSRAGSCGSESDARRQGEVS